MVLGMTDTTAPRPQTALDRVAERWADTEVELAPELRVELGLDGDTAEYNDYSPASFDAERSAVRAALDEIRATPEQDDVDRVTKLELERVLGLQLERLDAGLGYRDLNNIASPAQGARMIFDLMKQDCAEDFDAIARRMGNLPAALAGYEETLREGAEKGIVAAQRQVREVIEQTREYAKADGFFTKLATGEAATKAAGSALQAQLGRGAEQAREAYAKLADFLESEYLPKAAEQDAVGRELYALNSRAFLGATIDLDETYEWCKE